MGVGASVGAMMNTTVSRRFLVLAVSVIGAAWSQLAQADTFKFPLTGVECVPPVATNGTGEADVTYDPESLVVTWNITYSGLSSAVTMAHFHGPAAPGKSGPVVVWLTQRGDTPGNPIRGQTTLTSEQALQLTAGDWYVNLHTQSYPGCELRGQVTPSNS